MNESFDDEKLYDEGAQAFGPIAIRNYRQVLRGYSYNRYEQRFHALADSHRLAPSQRPKLDQNQFSALMKELADQLLTSREPDSLSNPTHQETAQRLLLLEDFEEDED